MTYKENITAILECYFTGFKKEIIDSACNRILEQEPKTGHWKVKSFHEVFCDNCGFDFDIMRNDFIDKMYFCPNCGCRMVEPQESEDKCKNCEYYHNPDYTRCHKCKAESEDKE